MQKLKLGYFLCLCACERGCVTRESRQPALWDLEQLQMSEATLCLGTFTRPASPSQTDGSACHRRMIL